ncbi:MAG: acetylglutamate kinase [Spirochaetaceae bacterium 4572_59]|nr:MAG: acetylglutamate kinase [Spirochaetaceae bacterium 4572_59]
MTTIVIKIGGKPAESETLLHNIAAEIKHLQDKGSCRFIFVHGGGTCVSAIQKQYGIEPVFIEGKRKTSAAEMDLVDMGLAGKVNKSLVRKFHQNGLRAVGLCGSDGSTFLSKDAVMLDNDENRTGSINHVDTSLVELIMRAGYFPVLSSVSSDSSGRGMNINADEAALAIAKALKADSLVFISDIPGILIHSSVRSKLNEAEIEKYIVEGDIQGGMIPKVRTSLAALRAGVRQIQISGYEEPGDLRLIIQGKKGSSIVL